MLLLVLMVAMVAMVKTAMVTFLATTCYSMLPLLPLPATLICRAAGSGGFDFVRVGAEIGVCAVLLRLLLCGCCDCSWCHVFLFCSRLVCCLLPMLLLGQALQFRSL